MSLMNSMPIRAPSRSGLQPTHFQIVKNLHFRYLGTVQHESKLRPIHFCQPLLAATVLGIAVLIHSAALAAESPASDRPVPGTEEKLFQALENNDATLLKAAIEAGAKVDCLDTNGMGPLLRILHRASEPLTAPQRHCVGLLLAQGANPNAEDSDKKTLLIHSVRIGDLDTIRLLVEAGAYVKARDRSHKTALIYAVDTRRRDIVSYLANNGDLQSLTYADRKGRQPKR
jgi:ankyrin repeat protein